ncbi:MAG TPA: hypothetical protein VMP89_07855 [Solirubrobacteraceae bacterium]|nr:hypothetical protein [Solirubrobacteraceae bacterium]
MSEALFEELRARGGALAACAKSPANGAEREPGPPQKAASGPRAAGHQAEYELLLEMILEGSLLHYGSPRVVHTDDQDLALLLGDQLYALGLARLAALGDLDAVDVLADVISQIAQANAEGDPDRAGVIWETGARVVGWGSIGSPDGPDRHEGS